MQTSLNRRVELLRRVPYFTGLAQNEVRRVAARVEERSYGRGQVIASAPHTSDGLYLVLSGRVTLYVTAPDGRERVVRAFGRGRTFGEIQAFGGGPCPGMARASVASRVGLIPNDDLRRLLTRHPQAASAALRLFATRMRGFVGMVEDLSLRPVAARIAGLLLGLSRGDPAIVEDAPTLEPRLTHHEIAGLVGSVRAVVQRELKALERVGAIRLGRARIQILDVQILERWKQGTPVMVKA